MSGRKGIVGLRDFKADAHDDDHDDFDEEEDDGGGGGGGAPPAAGRAAAEAYVGSGQNVVNPKGGKATADEIVKAATKAAKAAAAAGGAAEPRKPAVTITLYADGATVTVGAEAEGELRPYETEETKAFMAQLNAGRVPAEIMALLPPRTGAGPVDVTVSDKRKEKFVPPPYRAYGGAGATTGRAAPVAAGAVVRAGAGGGGAPAFTLDAAAPTTRVQVKLANGKKETLTLNLTHTVGDLQGLVAGLGGVAAGKAFILLGGVPPKPLDVAAATIEAAGLKNASVTQVAQ